MRNLKTIVLPVLLGFGILAVVGLAGALVVGFPAADIFALWPGASSLGRFDVFQDLSPPVTDDDVVVFINDPLARS